MRNLAEVTLIHKTDVFFDVLKPFFYNDGLEGNFKSNRHMHHGEIYIYHHQIYLYNGKNWYRANIREIKEIKSIYNHKKILIHFNNYDLLLFSKDYSHLLALRDYLYLFKEYEEIDSNLMLGSKSIGGVK